jgi:serine protease AprX
MPIFPLPVARVVVVALLAVASHTIASTSAFAQDVEPGGPKLDPVLQELSAQPWGKVRVIVDFNGPHDIRAITSRRGRVLPRRQHSPQVAEVDNRELTSLAADPRVARIMVDRPVFATLARTRTTVGAVALQQQLRSAGCGVGVATIDSGITATHDDLRSENGGTDGRVAYFKDFTREGVAGGAELASDEYGHGTHVSGIIAGSGYDSNGARSGIAPCAHLIVLKVLDADGNGYISDVIAAIDHAVANKDVFNIRVLNVSVAAGVFESARHDPLTLAAKRAVDAGIVVVAAAGNLGTNEIGEIQYGGITSPGNAPWVLTVGASTHQGTGRRSDDAVAPFSSRGPTFIDFLAKPDVVAPGVGIESLLAPNSTLAATQSAYALNGTRDPSQPSYLSLSGTSMAAPVVSGIVALLLEANPSLTPNAVKGLLQYTAQPLEGVAALAQGAGLVNAVGAVRLARFWGDTESGLGEASDVIEGETVPWSQNVIWGNFRVTGGVPLPGSNAWDPGTLWGALTGARGTPIVWGARTLDVSATSGRGNIVWATAGRENIVWATGGRGNIVWATGGRGNIVWATGGRNNIVWATGGRNNIVWATTGRNNIVWATAVAENLVWGDDCEGQNCKRVVWGEERDGTVWGTARSIEDIVSATSGGRNIVWATSGRGNIVWATSGRGNIVWATGVR